MPHLKYSGRYWRISSDELQIPVFCLIVFRVIWTSLLSIALSWSLERAALCDYGFYGVPFYLGIVILLFVLNIINCICMTCVSLTGLITEPEMRTRINYHLTAEMIIMFLEAISAIFGMFVFVEQYKSACFETNNKRELLLITVVIIFQFVDIFIVTCCCCAIKSRPYDDMDNMDDIENINGIGNGDGADDNNKIMFDMESGQPKKDDERRTSSASSYAGSMDFNVEEDETVYVYWLNRLKSTIRFVRCLSCNIVGGKNILEEDYEAMARMTTKLFHHDGFLDIVPGDVMAGLILVHMQQRKADCDILTVLNTPMGSGTSVNLMIQNAVSSSEHHLSEESGGLGSPSPSSANADSNSSSPRTPTSPRSPRSPFQTSSGKGIAKTIGADAVYGTLRREASWEAKKDRRKLLPQNEKDKQIIQDIADFMPYSLAVYSALMLALIKPCTFSCRICFASLLHCGQDVKEGIQKDKYGVHKAAAMHHLRNNMEHSELVYGNFGNDVKLSPYCIFLDHKKKMVVVSIRGTLSIEDAVTDAIAETVSMKTVGEKWNFNGKNRFAHEGILKSADFICSELKEKGILDKKLKELQGKGNNKNDYGLTIVGHSLGAALASVVSYILKSEYKDIQCFAFAPPACVFDPETAEECEDFITSVVLGDDCVPRINFCSLVHMRERVLDALVRSKVSKHVIFRTSYEDFDEDKYLYKEGEVPNSSLKVNVDAFNKKMVLHHRDPHTPECTIGGKIIHLVETSLAPKNISNSFKNRQIFTAYETPWRSMLEIPVSRYTIDHHWPHRYVDKCNQVREFFENGE